MKKGQRESAEFLALLAIITVLVGLIWGVRIMEGWMLGVAFVLLLALLASVEENVRNRK